MLLHPVSTTPPTRRRGAILLIVIVMLALMAVIGLSFALYGEAAALSARLRREAVAQPTSAPDATIAANAFLAKVIYPHSDIDNDILSAIRGYEMARMVYGGSGAGNNVPYNGVGTFHQQFTAQLPTATGTVPMINRRDIINYSLQSPRDAGGNLVAASRHVVDPEHTNFRNNVQLATAPAGSFVPKNAPYTYPDRNNIYVAMQDPATGRIVAQSYHRENLFGSLASANPNWTNDIGRYRTLRPRPTDHRLAGETTSQFPLPPANGDGTVTGDVQNIVNVDGMQSNDSVWINANLPTFTYRNRRVAALVAPTILPLDGRVNLNAVGNSKNGNAQGSQHGFGPYEINAGIVIGNTGDANNILYQRYSGGTTAVQTPNPRGTNLMTAAFSTSTPQSYASINWDGTGASGPLTLPAGLTSEPTYGAGYGDATEAMQHPSLFNPASWSAFTTNPNGPRVFPHTDLRRSAIKFGGQSQDYASPFFGSTVAASLNGTGIQNASNINRSLVTTISNSIHRPGLMANYRDYTARTLGLDPNGRLVDMTAPAERQLPLQFATAAVGTTDFGSVVAAGASNLNAVLANLGPLDLNRRLTDYRTNTAAPLAEANNVMTMMTQAPQANIDRNNLAADIFRRLIVATGAKASIDATTGVVTLPTGGMGTYTLVTGMTMTAVTQPEYDVLRYLAQLSVNIVDYLDNDDIITPFVWNAVSGSMDANDPANFMMMPVGDHIVYGVEKPRLVLNEAYSEVTNNIMDRPPAPSAMNPFQVRFFIELLNPANTEANANSPLAGADMSVPGSVPLTAGGHNIYQVAIYQSGSQVRSELNGVASNVDGAITSVMPMLQVDLSTLTSMANPADAQRIEPNNGQPATAGPMRNGIAVIGPQVAPAGPMDNEYVPSDVTLLTKMTNPMGMATDRLEYEIPQTNDIMLQMNVRDRVRDHAIVLRRLANPYLAPGPTNPYITVDFMSHVAANDAINVVEGPAGMPMMGMRTASMPTMIGMRTAIGRVQPYTGQEAGPMNPTMDPVAPAVYPMSLTVGQNPTPPVMGSPLLTLFRHNSQTAGAMASDATIQLPFHWLTHLDRPLINQAELLHVGAVKPHELTHQFAQPGAATPTFDLHAAQWTSANAPLYRALELLSTKPRINGVGTGGRVAGKVNLNMIWNQNVLSAVLDPQLGNGFTSNEVNTLWTNLFTGTTNAGTRTKNFPNIGKTFDEYEDGVDTRPQLDRPFKSLGIASFTPGGLLAADMTSTAPAGNTGIEDTILRTGVLNPPMPPMPQPLPLIWNTNAAAMHPYKQAEMLRKLTNNFTTTTDSYLVVMTVGFFEVRNTGAIDTTNPMVLGSEVFDEIPGDLRAKFVAVVDRSMLGFLQTLQTEQATTIWQSEVVRSTTPPATPATPPAPMGAVGLQFLANGNSAGAIQVNYEGTPVNINATAGNNLIYYRVNGQLQTATVVRLGVDANGNGNTTDGVDTMPFDNATGIATVTVTGITALPEIGSTLGNAVLGNPGRQANFDVNAQRYQGVVPYFDRVRP